MTQLLLPDFTPENHKVRELMLARQLEKIEKSHRVSRHLLTGIDLVQFDEKQIPNVIELSKRLGEATGRSLCDAEDPYLSHDRRFDHLAHKRFPVTNYIRPLKDIDYTPLPDLFHEYFGHMPQMFQQFFADIEEQTARLHKKALTPEQQQHIFNISRRTIEYGVLWEDQTTKVVGTGILSAPGDLDHFCNNGFILEDASLEKLITEKPSPHEQHKKLFVFESLEQRTHLLETYEAKYL